jgi:hypothetical protein
MRTGAYGCRLEPPTKTSHENHHHHHVIADCCHMEFSDTCIMAPSGWLGPWVSPVDAIRAAATTTTTTSTARRRPNNKTKRKEGRIMMVRSQRDALITGRFVQTVIRPKTSNHPAGNVVHVDRHAGRSRCRRRWPMRREPRRRIFFRYVRNTQRQKEEGKGKLLVVVQQDRFIYDLKGRPFSSANLVVVHTMRVLAMVVPPNDASVVDRSGNNHHSQIASTLFSLAIVGSRSVLYLALSLFINAFHDFGRCLFCEWRWKSNSKQRSRVCRNSPSARAGRGLSRLSGIERSGGTTSLRGLYHQRAGSPHPRQGRFSHQG